MYYKGLTLRVKYCSCKLFLTHYLDVSGSWKGLLGDISPLPELPIQEINVRTTQGEERHPRDYFRTNISHQEGLFKESYSISAYSKAKKIVMAIVILLAIETVMAIVTVLAIETDIHGYHDRPGH